MPCADALPCWAMQGTLACAGALSPEPEGLCLAETNCSEALILLSELVGIGWGGLAADRLHVHSPTLTQSTGFQEESRREQSTPR